MEQKAEELYEGGWCASKATVFSRWTGVSGFKVYRNETANVREIIRRFQRQFPNRNFHYRRRACSNINHTGHCNCLLFFDCTYDVLGFGNCLLKPVDCFQNITSSSSVYFKTINTRSSSEKCGLKCAPTIFVQSCSIRLFHFLFSLIVQH